MLPPTATAIQEGLEAKLPFKGVRVGDVVHIVKMLVDGIVVHCMPSAYESFLAGIGMKFSSSLIVDEFVKIQSSVNIVNDTK